MPLAGFPQPQQFPASSQRAGSGIEDGVDLQDPRLDDRKPEPAEQSSSARDAIDPQLDLGFQIRRGHSLHGVAQLI
jgi:predicted Rdx family selenoprotein